jgi:hypothetical protein
MCFSNIWIFSDLDYRPKYFTSLYAQAAFISNILYIPNRTTVVSCISRTEQFGTIQFLE